MALADKTCPACRGDMPRLTAEQMQPLLAELKGWTLTDDAKLQKSIKTPDFKRALELANAIGAVAEQENHHPDLLVRWGEVRIDLWTHAIDGLSEADFILAAKIDRVEL
jgi:4a-hydroxytetrahydrobiopterin dehydratase